MVAPPKPGSIVHIELITKETEGVKSFFSSVFGWKFQDIPQMAYTTWEAPGGPSGGLMAPRPEQPGTGQPLNYIYVESINAIVPKIESAGGKVVVNRTPIPGFGWFAFFQYPENMIWGLYESEPTSSAPRKSRRTKAAARARGRSRRKAGR